MSDTHLTCIAIMSRLEETMPRGKRVNVGRMQGVELDLNDTAHAALWDYYLKLTISGKAADWIRNTLVAALPAKSRTSIQQPGDGQVHRASKGVSYSDSAAGAGEMDEDDEDLHYEEVAE